MKPREFLLWKLVSKRMPNRRGEPLMIVRIPDSGHFDRNGITVGNRAQNGALDNQAAIVSFVSDRKRIAGGLKVRARSVGDPTIRSCRSPDAMSPVRSCGPLSATLEPLPDITGRVPAQHDGIALHLPPECGALFNH